MENTYKNKYLKYKTKYVMLKNFNQVGNGKNEGGNQNFRGFPHQGILPFYKKD